ncbi:hypothetical protein, partial [Rahnella inusitata]|uniref:hypothetical protein n=1 Tax=Rahnella inusitata TaxID=58169 RepID=UPI001B7D643B
IQHGPPIQRKAPFGAFFVCEIQHGPPLFIYKEERKAPFGAFFVCKIRSQSVMEANPLLVRAYSSSPTPA